MTKLETPNKTNEKSSTTGLDSTKKQLEVMKLPEVIDENRILKIGGLASALGLQKEKKTLPNGKEIMTISRKPSDLPHVFEIISKSENKNKLGKNDVVTIDGACPGRLLTTIAHALHPINVAVKYPQGGADATLPVTGFEMAENGEGQDLEGDVTENEEGQDLEFNVTENEEYTLVEFSLMNQNINAQKTMNSLIAPNVPIGKPVVISGRGLIAIFAAIADAYSHIVPYVACFQPGTGNVVAISHSDVNLGTIIE